MKNSGNNRTAGLAGSAAGIALFLLIGLSHGALIGGTAGLQAGSALLGSGTPMLLRTFGAAGMLAGIVLSGMIFTTLGFVAGRLAGFVWTLGLAEGAARGTAGAKGN